MVPTHSSINPFFSYFFFSFSLITPQRLNYTTTYIHKYIHIHLCTYPIHPEEEEEKNPVAKVISKIMIPFKSLKSRFDTNKGVSFSFHSLFRQVVRYYPLLTYSLSLRALENKFHPRNKKKKKLHIKE